MKDVGQRRLEAKLDSKVHFARFLKNLAKSLCFENRVMIHSLPECVSRLERKTHGEIMMMIMIEEDQRSISRENKMSHLRDQIVRHAETFEIESGIRF